MSQDKEQYWSQFARDFEARNTYVVGKQNLELLYTHLSSFTQLGKTLELGCGNGTYSKIIHPNTESLIATDYSDEMVDVAKERLSTYGALTVQKEDCFSLSFKKETFDTIFMANLLHVIPNPEDALQECYRVLKPSGRLIIASYTTEKLSLPHKLTLFYRYLKTYGRPSKTAYTLTADLAGKLLERQGFHDITSKIIGKTMHAIVLTAKK